LIQNIFPPDARQVSPTLKNELQNIDPKAPLHVVITREPWMDFFSISLDNGYSEELNPEETRHWFKIRGANMDILERALDDCWNFYKTEYVIENPKVPSVANPRLQPKLDI
jgi:hypothetical protein